MDSFSGVMNVDEALPDVIHGGDISTSQQCHEVSPSYNDPHKNISPSPLYSYFDGAGGAQVPSGSENENVVQSEYVSRKMDGCNAGLLTNKKDRDVTTIS